MFVFQCFDENVVSVYILHMCHFFLVGELRTFCSGIVTHVVVGTYEKRKGVLLNFLGVVLTKLCL